MHDVLVSREGCMHAVFLFIKLDVACDYSNFNKCVDYWLTSRKMVQMLSEGVAKFKYRKANSAFNAWQYATGTGEYAPSLLSACTRSPRRLSPHRYGRVCSFPPERRQAELVDVWPCPAGILV